MANDKQNTSPNVPNKGHVPRLRFPEFSEDWVQVPLSEISERVTRKNKNNISKLPLTISAQYGLVDQITFFNKVVASADMSNYYLLKKGEFAYNKSYSSDYPWGAIKRLDRYDEGALSTLYICFNIKKCTDSDFALQYFESPKWHREVSNIAGEGARNHGLLNIAVGDFFNTKHYLPSSIDEQQKIAKLLSLLDQRIATQNKIIEQLQSLIKGIYDKTFANFSKYQALSSICKIQKGQQVNGEELSEYGEYYVMNGGIEPSGYYDKYNTLPNTISISEGGNSCGYVQFNTVPFWSGGHCYSLQDINIEYSTHFVYHYLKSKEKEIKALRIGSGLPNIQKKDLEKFPIPVLSLETQISIVNGINKIETKLKYEKDILSAYQTQKAYLLRNLFI